MARWDDLHRAIEAKDHEGAERIWLELVEADPGEVDRFIAAGHRQAVQPGGKREAGILLWMLAEALKEKGRDRDLIRVYGALARTGPDDGTIRTGVTEAARRAYAGRADLEAVLEKSGVLHGATTGLGEQCDALERYLQLEPGAFVFHKSGWGAGRIVQYLPEQGRCVIDFQGRPGHAMDIEAAAKILERLPAEDIRAMALADPAALRAFAREKPLEALRQVLQRFKGNALLKHVKDALVPDAVAEGSWTEWWKEARRQAFLDPRFHVGTGRDPRIEYHESARVDFKAQVEKTLKGSGTTVAKQKAVGDLLTSVGEDPEAKKVLAAAARVEADRTAEVGARLAWEMLFARAEGRDPVEGLRGFFVGAADPGTTLRKITDDSFRGQASRVILESRPDGADVVLAEALRDDPVVADAVVDHFARVGKPEYLDRLLDRVDEAPVQYPTLFAWYVKGLRRRRWEGRSASAYALAERVLKVLDAVEYRARRSGSTDDRAAVSALEGVLSEKSCALFLEASDATDAAGARHLLRLLEKNLGLKGRLLQKLQDTLFHNHPTALKEGAGMDPAGAEAEAASRSQQIYMTREGMERLRAEHDRIVNHDLPANAAEIARAREFGDLRENAEYHAARERHSLLEARAKAIKADLTRAVPITRDIVRTDAVSVGTKVQLRDSAGEERTYVLLGPPDAAAERGIISYLTPMGQALMGKRSGEKVVLDLGDDRHEFFVLDIGIGVP